MKQQPIIKTATIKQLPSNPAQNFGLTADAFETMLLKMQNGEETLFEQVFLAHFEDCIKYLMNRYKINHSLAYDVSMDALLKFRKRLIAGKIAYGNMRFLFTRMAGQFLSDSTKHRTILLNESENDRVEDAELEEDVLDALDKAWNQLCENCSGLLNKFYYQKIALKTMSLQLGKSEAAIRKQKQRCLEKLRLYFLKFHKT